MVKKLHFIMNFNNIIFIALYEIYNHRDPLSLGVNKNPSKELL